MMRARCAGYSYAYDRSSPRLTTTACFLSHESILFYPASACVGGRQRPSVPALLADLSTYLDSAYPADFAPLLTPKGATALQGFTRGVVNLQLRTFFFLQPQPSPFQLSAFVMRFPEGLTA